MSLPQVYEKTWARACTNYVMARAKRKNSSHNLVDLASTDLTSITRTIYRMNGDVILSTIAGPTTLTPLATYVLDTPSSGDVWTQGGTFNFLDTLPTTAFPAIDGTTDFADTIYRVKYVDTLTGGEVFKLEFEGPAI